MSDIPEHINDAWFGWQAFRRGLGTRLNEMGLPDQDIQLILRHVERPYNPGVLHSAERRTSQDRDEETKGDGAEEVRHQGIIARRRGAHSSIG
jgi:hypothetical protein